MWPTSTFDEVAALQRQVRSFGACSLPGVSIVYDRFMDIMWRAVSRGYVSRQHADFVAKGLWHGFDCGIDVKKLRGKRRYLNYKSALEARSQVTKATKVRVSQRKTLLLCKIPEAYRVDNLTASLLMIIAFFHWVPCLNRWSRQRLGLCRITPRAV